MERSYEQFYRTWCYSGRSVNGADGWKIRAKSDGLALQEAEGMADLANYWSPTEASADKPPGRRLALFRQAGQAVLAHGVLIPNLVGGRTGVSFEHVIAKLPLDFSAFDAIKLWRSFLWHTEDNSQTPTQLEPCILNGSEFYSEFSDSEKNVIDFENRDGAVAVQFLSNPEVNRWADFVIRACLALFSEQVEKFYLAGNDDTIAHLLLVAFYCLPESLRCNLTFSTHENPKGTKGVQIVGVTTFEGGESDLASYSYSGKYCALNTFNGAKTETLLASLFAETAMQWLLCGQYSLLALVRQRFDDLDCSDNPTLDDLNLLTEFTTLPSDAAIVASGLLKLCGSPAIGRWMIRDFEQLSSLISEAQANVKFRRELVFQLASWLPKHGMASQEFPAGLARIGLGRLRNGCSFQELQWLEDLATTVGSDLRARYWEQLLILCRPLSSRELLTNISAPLETRLKLLIVWQKLHGLDTLEDLVESSLRVGAKELVEVLESGLKLEFKQRALELWLSSANDEDFATMIGQIQQNEDFQKSLIAAWPRSECDLVAFAARLTSFGLKGLRSGRSFEDIIWIGSFSGQIAPELASQFWEHLWSVASPQEFTQVLSSKLQSHLKQQAVQFFCQAGGPLNCPTTHNIFTLISEDKVLTKYVVLNLPTWQANGAIIINSIQDSCLDRLLISYSQIIRPADLNSEAWLRAVDLWNTHRSNLIPDRMKSMIAIAHAADAVPGALESRYVDGYRKLNKPEDAEFQKLIIQRLFSLAERQPMRLRAIIKAFAEGDDNFVRQFLPVFQTSILEWEYQRKDGKITGEYLNFCLSDDFEKVCKGQSKEAKIERQRFIDSVLISFSFESKKLIDRAAATWNRESRKRWATERKAKPWWKNSGVLALIYAAVSIIALWIVVEHLSDLRRLWHSIHDGMTSLLRRLHLLKPQ